jgi:RNA polymerase sigma-70 factor (ECF subfamily)
MYSFWFRNAFLKEILKLFSRKTQLSNDQAFERLHYFVVFCGNPVFSASLQEMILGKRAYLKSLNDEKLIEVFKQQQWPACIDELYRRYAHLVYGVQLKYTKSCADAEDLTMECFEKLPQLLLKHEINYLKGWLHTVARNAALGFLRKNKIQHLQIEEQHPIDIDSELLLLEWALVQLKEQQKRCITLFYLEQNSYEQIMQKTGYSYNEVKSHVQNGKRKLKVLMDQHKQNESK